MNPVDYTYVIREAIQQLSSISGTLSSLTFHVGAYLKGRLENEKAIVELQQKRFLIEISKEPSVQDQ